MRSSRHRALLVVAGLLFGGCGGASLQGSEPDAAVSPPVPGVGSDLALVATDQTSDSGGVCPTGEAWVAPMVYDTKFNGFCGQPCNVTPDCPAGFACVVGLMENPASPVCVSDTVPSPLGRAPNWGIVDAPVAVCYDGTRIGNQYKNDITGILGYELTTCPNGCKKNPDGGMAPARCN
jgi:hypothetical protein